MTRHLIETAVVAAAAVVVSYVVGWAITRGTDDEYGRRSVRRAIDFVTFLVALVVVGYVWGVFSRRTTWAIGLAAAGFAFALQELLGAVAGWFNIMLGGIYRIGDRIEIAGVHGDVIDITPVRTKILEIGGTESASTDLWVHGRQATGRIVTVSNKATFDEPTFNYSTLFQFVWHEVTVPVPHEADWRRAEEIMQEAALEVSPTQEAQSAVDEMRKRYPIPISDLEPRVFARATDNYLELSARFVIEVRTARVATDEFTRLVKQGLADAGIPFGSTTMDVTLVASGDDRTTRESSRSG